MRIGVYLPQFDPKAGGAFTFEKTIMKALEKAESKHQIYFIYFGKKIFSKNASIKYINLASFPIKFNNFFIKITSKFYRTNLLNKIIKENKIDLIYSPSIFSEKINIPYILTIWDLQHRLQPYFPELQKNKEWIKREKLYNKILKPASFIITGTERGKKEIIHFYNIAEERVRVIPFPTPDFVINPPESTKDVLKKYEIAEKYIYYPAQFWAHKNHFTLLMALNILKKEYLLDLTLVLSGSDKGNLNYIKKKTIELGLEEQVRFLGFVPLDSVVELYKKAFALVFPSYFGPDNIPPLEAFALGCPVIAANVPGSEEQLGNACLYFDPSNPVEIALQIKNLYDNDNLRKILVKKGLNRALSWQSNNYGQKINSIFNEFESYNECWF